MQEQKQDTRNRFQKLYDLQYRQQIEGKATLETLITPQEAQELIKRNGNTNIDHIEKLLIRNGYSYLHPRTYERIISHYKSTREDIRLIQKLQPCTPYGQEANRTRGKTFKSLKALRTWIKRKGQGNYKTKQHIGHKTGQFKTVWYSGNMRRK